MGRIAGAKNKSKTFGVPLSKINTIFMPETVIEIDIKYAPIFGVELQERQETTVESKRIDFIVEGA